MLGIYYIINVILMDNSLKNVSIVLYCSEDSSRNLNSFLNITGNFNLHCLELKVFGSCYSLIVLYLSLFILHWTRFLLFRVKILGLLLGQMTSRSCLNALLFFLLFFFFFFPFYAGDCHLIFPQLWGSTHKSYRVLWTNVTPANSIK